MLEGVLQFGPSIDKRKIQGLVRDTSWNGFLELNRMAFSDRLPKNSESRALAIAFRLIRKHYPHVEWIISFADGTQSGDGTIYRASGFLLTGIRKNTTIWAAGDVVVHDIAIKSQPHKKSEIFSRVTDEVFNRTVLNRVTVTKGQHMETGGASMSIFKEAGFKPLPGFQLRYIYFLNSAARDRLTVPVLPFSKIDEMGARMYLGQARGKQAMAGDHPDQRRGSSDPHAPKTRPRL